MAVHEPNIALTLEAPQRQSDGIGGYRIEWCVLGQIWGAMAASAGRVQSGEVGPQSVVGWRITVRAAPTGDPRRPVAGQRLRIGSRLFSIDAVAEADRAGRWLTCFAKEEDRK